MNYVKEIEVHFKPRLDITTLESIISLNDCLTFLRKIWADDIEYRERFYVVYLNRKNKILGYFLLSAGGSCSTVVDIKMVFQPAISLHASFIIIAHNHPSGTLEPSPQDCNLTKKIADIGLILDIRILDHIILTVDNYYSFSDNKPHLL